MALKYFCKTCGNIIIVSYIKPGDESICRNCGTINIVPLNAEQTEEKPVYKPLTLEAKKTIERKKALSPIEEFKLSLKILSVALLFYALNFNFTADDLSNGVQFVFPITFIGRILAIYSLFLLRKYESSWPLYSLGFLIPIQAIFDIMIILGYGFTYYTYISPFELLLIIILLRRALLKEERLKILERTISSVLVVEITLFIISIILGITFLLTTILQMQNFRNTKILIIILLSSSLTLFIINFSMSIILIYASVKIYKTLNAKNH